MRPAGPEGAGALSRRRAEPLEALSIDGLSEEALPFFEKLKLKLRVFDIFYNITFSDAFKVFANSNFRIPDKPTEKSNCSVIEHSDDLLVIL